MSLSILIIDDEPHLPHQFARYLRKHGYEVATVADGESGLEVLEKDNIDLVLLDIGLVGADVGLGGGELGLLRLNLCLDLLFIQLRQGLAFLYDIVNVHIQFFHDARGLALDLDLGNGLNLPGGDDRARHITAGDLGEPVGIDGGPLG